MYVYRRIRDMREDRDKTQAEIAAVLDVSRQQYRRWESGENEIPVHHMVTLARYYGVSMDFLTGIVDYIKPISK